MKVNNIIYKPVVHVFLIVVLSLLAYSGTFQVPFHFDDDPYIIDNQRIRTLSNIPSLFADIKGPIGSRPFTLATFAINFYFGGLNTFGYHVFNIIIHIMNGILLYSLIMITGRLLNYMEKDIRLVAFFSSLVFITHPVQTECVTYIVGRSTPLITVFYLSGMILFVKAVNSKKAKVFYIAGLFIVSMFGMASRENFVTFPLMLILYDLFFVSGNNVKSVINHYKIHTPVVLTLAYFVYLTLSYDYQIESGLSYKVLPFEYLRTQFNVHWTYVRLLVLPVNQNLDYYYPVSKTLFEFPTIFSFIGYVGLWGAGFYLWKRKSIISFCILWFMITLSPVSSIIPLANMIFEHRLYLPSIGIIVAIIIVIFYVLNLIIRNSRISLAIYFTLLTAVISAFAWATYERNIVWKDEISLWKDVISKGPRNARGHGNLGDAYYRKGLIEEAIKEYRTAIILNPEDITTYDNLSTAIMIRNAIKANRKKIAGGKTE